MATKKLQLLGNFGTGGDIKIDNTLTQSGQAADAEATGEKISGIETQINNINSLVGDTPVADQIAAVAAEKSDKGHTHTAAEIGADVSGAAAGALESANSYTDTKIADLINSAPTTLDTLGEIATAMEENADVVAALDAAVGTKANASDLEDLSALVGDEAVSTQISNAVADMEIGGRNLLRGTQYWDSVYWSYIGNQTVSGEIVLVDATAETSGYKQTYQSISLQEGKTYTLSVDLLSAQSSAFTGVWIIDSTLSQRHYAINLPAGTASQAKRYSGTFTVPSGSSSFAVYIRANAGASIQVQHIQLEEGNKATAWEPALEDIIPITKGGTGAENALNAMINLKGLPIISAAGSSYDMNTIAETGELALYSYNVNTLNTPYKAGVTSATLGYILNIPDANYPAQFAIGKGATRLYRRAGKAGTWKVIADQSDITSSGSGLDFTPVQQGGGTNQGDNKIYLGWSNENKLNVQVDSTNLGNLITDATNYGVILPVAKGGTGAKTAANARTNLGITPANIGAAPASHNQSASTITSGTLSANRLPTIAVTKGGTGATDAATARTNLGITPANIGAAVYTPIAYTEIDNISASGIYRTTGTPGLLIHMNWDVNYAYQILNLYSGNNGLIGRYKHSDGNWSAWTELDNRDYIKDVSNDTTLTIGLDGNITPVISGLKGGKAQWAIGGYTADLNHLVMHYYNNGAWAGNHVLLDSDNYSNYANTKINIVKSGNTSVAVGGSINLSSLNNVKSLITNINGISGTISLYNATEGSINAIGYFNSDDRILAYGIGFTYSGTTLTITKMRCMKLDSNGAVPLNITSATIGTIYSIG